MAWSRDVISEQSSHVGYKAHTVEWMSIVAFGTMFLQQQTDCVRWTTQLVSCARKFGSLCIYINLIQR